MVENSNIVRETLRKWYLLLRVINHHEPDLPFNEWSKYYEYNEIINTLNEKMNKEEQTKFMKLTKVTGFFAITMQGKLK